MALEGNLIDMSLVDLLQVFGMSSKTGKLMLEQPGRCGGMLWISKGSIANAAIIDLSTLTSQYIGEDAVIEMMQWEDATFRFSPPAPDESYQTTISRSNEWLILQGLRKRDESEARSLYPQVGPDTRLRLVANPGIENDQVQLNPQEWRVLTYIASAKTVSQVLEATGYPESEAFGILGRLMALRLVEVDPEDILPARALHADKVMPSYQREDYAMSTVPVLSTQVIASPSIAPVIAATAISTADPYDVFSAPQYSGRHSHYDREAAKRVEPQATGLRGLLRAIKDRLTRSA